MAQSETIPQPFKYAGQFGVQAEENNLYYMRARYYDADIGRFISEDPIGFEGGLNLYAYAGGNPVMFVDPSGFSAERIGISQAQIVQFQQDAFDIAIGFALPVSKAGGLFQGIASNLLRFEKKLPANVSATRIFNLPGGGKAFQADSASKNIPGSFAQYEKQVDAAGKTLQYTKTTFGPRGEIIKDKISGQTFFPGQ
jgi:RHS repeat-associated protein